MARQDCFMVGPNFFKKPTCMLGSFGRNLHEWKLSEMHRIGNGKIPGLQCLSLLKIADHSSALTQ